MRVDKIQHFVVGAVLGAVLTHLGAPLLIALCCVFIIAGTNELLDLWTNKGTPEYADLMYTLLGGLIGALVL